MNRHPTQAYKQAPWRKQIQIAAMFLVALLSMALVAGIYLEITARTATAAIQIQELEVERKNYQRINANLEAQLGQLLSIDQMAKRADEMGYIETTDDNKQYLVIAGYPGRQPVTIANKVVTTPVRAETLRFTYTESLSEWIVNKLTRADQDSTAGDQ
jgi:cell division protein FtsL